jgi:hypothetical protein
MREIERNGLVEIFIKRIEGYSVADLRSVRDGLRKRLMKNETSLGDREADELALGCLEQMIARCDMEEAEVGKSPEEVAAEDVRRLAAIGGVGEKIAAKFIKKHGSPWADARKHREVAAPAPEATPALDEGSWTEKHKAAHAAYAAYLKRQQDLKDD